MEVWLAQHEQVIKALVSNAFQESFTNGIGVGSSDPCFEDFNARFCGNASGLLTKFTVIIANETLRLLIKRSRFTQLVCVQRVERVRP